VQDFGRASCRASVELRPELWRALCKASVELRADFGRASCRASVELHVEPCAEPHAGVRTGD
jgi:hypothetical protein